MAHVVRMSHLPSCKRYETKLWSA